MSHSHPIRHSVMSTDLRLTIIEAPGTENGVSGGLQFTEGLDDIGLRTELRHPVAEDEAA